MARSLSTDFLHNMRFHVTVVDTVVGNNPNSFLIGGANNQPAGFVSCSAPSMTADAVEYREGSYIYARKYPGFPAVGNVSMSRGVVKGDSSFLVWMFHTISGPGEYRADLDVKHFHRDGLYAGGGAAITEVSNIQDKDPARTYQLKQCFPTSHKVAGDLEASSADVSVMELEVALEYFTVKDPQAEFTST